MVDVAVRQCTVDAISGIAHRNVFFEDPSLVLVEEEFRSRGREGREGREVQRKREPREGLSLLCRGRATLIRAVATVVVPSS